MNEKKTGSFLPLGSRPAGTLRPLVFDAAVLLAEDFRQRGTWLRLLPVTPPLAWRLVLG